MFHGATTPGYESTTHRSVRFECWAETETYQTLNLLNYKTYHHKTYQTTKCNF